MSLFHNQNSIGKASSLTLTGHQDKGPDTSIDPKVKVHNADLYVEYMQAADWSETPPSEKPASASKKGTTTAKKPPPKKYGSSFGPPPGTTKPRKPNQSSSSGNSTGTTSLNGTLNGTTEKQREAFMEKQVVREQQFRQKFEVAKQQAERRAKEKAEQKEKEFEARFLDFVERNHSLVHEVDGAVRADEAWRTRKRERLFNEWTLKVFQPMQEEINNKIASTNSDEIESKRRQMFQSFLDESNRKTNGLFRDIIIESDYDPVAQQKSAAMSYAKAKVMEDPTKNRSTREEGDRMVRGLMEERRSHKGDTGAEKQPRLFVNVEMWDRMEATPYGRYSNEKERKVKEGFMKSNVGFDHYTFKRGAEAFQGEREIRGKAKGPSNNHAVESSIKECFKMPTKKERVPRPMTQAPVAGQGSEANFLPPISQTPPNTE